jgi:hypothetical protein
LATRRTASSCPTTRWCRRLFHQQQFLALALHHFRDRDAGRPRNDFGDLLGTDLGAQQLVLPTAIARLLGHRQLRLELRQLAVLDFGHLVPFVLALQLRQLKLQLVDLFLDVRTALHLCLFGLPDFIEVVVLAFQLEQFLLDQMHALLRAFIALLAHRLALDLELDHAAVELVHHLGLGVDLHLDPRRRLVDQVDRLVRAGSGR